MVGAKLRSLCLLLIPLLLGADVITVPEKVAGNAGDFITVKATLDASAKSGVVKWVVIDKGIRLFPSELLKSTQTAIVIGSAPGQYRLLAYTATDAGPSDPVICIVMVGQGPIPPGPNPPTPTDPLYGKLKAAFDIDPDTTNRIENTNKLAAVYRVASTGLANDPALTTYGVIHERLATLVASQLVPEHLRGVRRAIADELNATLGVTPTTAMDAALRKKVSEQFARVATMLDALTP